jgi:hypothetical protein
LRDLGAGRRIILKMTFKEIGYEQLDWINVAQDKFQESVYASRKPSFCL